MHKHRHTTVATLPPGAGKTYVATLLAMKKENEGKSTAIVTSEGFLVTQMEKMLGPLS